MFVRVSVVFSYCVPVANIIPLHKKMKKSYLQITEQFHFCLHFLKYLKRLSLNNYINLKKKQLLYNAQYGFKTDHFTEFATLELIDGVILEMDKNNTPLNICLDLSKAFDTLDHKILLKKLSIMV